MQIAIMQPYLFPYLGYFQLIHAVDKFIVLDSVNYINRGWINRNQILLQGKPFMFSLPLKGSSQNKLICEISIGKNELWKKKFFKTLKYAYQKSINYDRIINLLNSVFDYPNQNLSDFLINSLKIITSYMEIDTKFISSREVDLGHKLTGVDRLIEITKSQNAGVYINPIGGQELYNKEEFKEADIELYFLKSKDIKYQQNLKDFIPNLSIIDLLMNVAQSDLQKHLREYELI